MSLLLAGKAEVVLAALLVSRHRSVRLAASAAAAAAVAWVWRDASSDAARVQIGPALLITGMLASVSASRPLAPGGTLAAAWSAAGPWWLVPVGRLFGCVLVTAPVTAVAAATAGASGAAAARLGLIVLVYLSTVGSVVLAATPVVGATAAAGVSLVLVWLGTLTPDLVSQAMSGWPLLGWIAALLWNGLPLTWRAQRWFEHGGMMDLLVLGAWLVSAGLTSAALVRLTAWDRVSVGRR